MACETDRNELQRTGRKGRRRRKEKGSQTTLGALLTTGKRAGFKLGLVAFKCCALEANKTILVALRRLPPPAALQPTGISRAGASLNPITTRR